MSYELRLDRHTVRTFESVDDAIACARRELQANPDIEPELRDSATGNPVVPAASKSWREDLSKEVGY